MQKRTSENEMLPDKCSRARPRTRRLGRRYPDERYRSRAPTCTAHVSRYRDGNARVDHASARRWTLWQIDCPNRRKATDCLSRGFPH